MNKHSTKFREKGIPWTFFIRNVQYSCIIEEVLPIFSSLNNGLKFESRGKKTDISNLVVVFLNHNFTGALWSISWKLISIERKMYNWIISIARLLFVNLITHILDYKNVMKKINFD